MSEVVILNLFFSNASKLQDNIMRKSEFYAVLKIVSNFGLIYNVRILSQFKEKNLKTNFFLIYFSSRFS